MRHTSPYHCCHKTAAPISRREFLWRSGGGLGGIALASLLNTEGLLGMGVEGNEASRHTLHPASIYPPKAKRVVQMFMAGAASHVDLFDYKPELKRRHG